jgi:threonine/homoserine/homoserine lactone efflux protein
MPLHTWWTFAVAAFFISGTPGPNMLYMLNSGIRHGLKPTFFTMAGCMLALLSISTASALGLGAVLAESPHVFDVLRYLGAAYLIYLGVRAAFAPAAGNPVNTETTAIPAAITPYMHFRSGFMVCISNPKALLFATAFFPQFINDSAPRLPQFAILLTTGFCIELGWYMIYATGGSRIAKYLREARTQKILNRCIGTLFAVFGVLLLKWHPN